MLRAAFVMKVRRPEWLEQPSKPKRSYQVAKRLTMTCADVDGDRSVVMTLWWLSGKAVILRHSRIATRNSFAMGIVPPVLPFAAELVRLIVSVSAPSESVTIPHVSDAISLALNPALTDSRTMALLRWGERVRPIMSKSVCCCDFVKTLAWRVSIR